MPPRTPARKALTVLGCLLVAGVFLWFGSQVVLMSGTKATFSFVGVSAVPAGGAGGSTRTTTTSASTTTSTTAAKATTTTAVAEGQ